MPIGPCSWCDAYSAFMCSVTFKRQNFCSIVFSHSSSCNGSSTSLKIGGLVSRKSLKSLNWLGSGPWRWSLPRPWPHSAQDHAALLPWNVGFPWARPSSPLVWDAVVVGGPHCYCHGNHYHLHRLHQLPYGCASSVELQPQVTFDDVRKIVEELYNYAKLNLLERIYIHTIKQRHNNSFPQHNITNYIT